MKPIKYLILLLLLGLSVKGQEPELTNTMATNIDTDAEANSFLGNLARGTSITFDELAALNNISGNIQGLIDGKQSTITFGTGVQTALGANIGSAGAPVLLGGGGGTPSSLTLTNATGLPASGLVPSTSQAVGFGTIELGHASDTTLSRSAAGKLAAEGIDVALTNDTRLTDERVPTAAGLASKINGINVQAALDIVNFQPFVTKKIQTWAGSTNPPVRGLVLGDSFATMVQPGPNMGLAGVIGLGAANITGTVTTGSNFNYWTNGVYTSAAVGSTHDLTYGGQATGDIRGDTAYIAFIKKSGGGTFDLQYQKNATGTWTTLATIDTSNASTIGAVETYALSASNSPYYRLRITNVTTAAVDYLFAGIYYANGGGLIWMPICNGVGHQISQANTVPNAVFDPIYTSLAPDFIISSWLEMGDEWDVGGDFRDLYDRWNAIKSDTDWIQIGPHPVDETAAGWISGGASIEDHISGQRQWAIDEAQTFIDTYSMFHSYAVANARGFMGDTIHLSNAGQLAAMDKVWRTLPLGSYPLGAIYRQNNNSARSPAIGMNNIGQLADNAIEINNPFRLRGSRVRIASQSKPFDEQEDWSVSNTSGSLAVSKYGTNSFTLGLSSYFGIHAGFNDAMIGRDSFAWRATLTGLNVGYVEKTANYTLTTADFTVNVTANSPTITLPLSEGTAATNAGYKGRLFVIANTGAGIITLATTSSQLIDGASPGTIAAGAKLRLQSTGSGWITF